MRAQITLLSGAQIEVDIDDITTRKNVVTGEFTKLEWTTPDEWAQKLHTIQLDQIAAVVLKNA